MIVRERPGLVGTMLTVLLTLAGCLNPASPDEKIRSLDTRLPKEWQTTLETRGGVPLVYAVRVASAGARRVIYIEGDGMAWRTRAIPSSDPTPKNPLLTDIAGLTPEDFDAAYIARPCQFEARTRPECQPNLWTQGRYSEPVIAATNRLINELVSDGPRATYLVGYSGGGVIAALVAARREDIDGLITFAANMDTDAWTSYHRVSPLQGSLNPADFSEPLGKLPQFHYVGADDAIVPAAVLESYLARIGLDKDAHRRVVSGFDHRCCWRDNWSALFAQALVHLEQGADTD